jgi:hypothetical protein
MISKNPSSDGSQIITQAGTSEITPKRKIKHGISKVSMTDEKRSV